jgi:hypothetical protein
VTRRMVRQSIPTHGVAVLLACLCAVGCGSGPVEKLRDPSVQRIKAISRAYLEATQDLNRPPLNLEELTPFLKKYGEPSEILRSPHDGQEYTILYGVDFREIHERGTTFPVLIYETQGTDGKRYVGGLREVKRMTDEEFKSATFPPGHKAPL